MESGELHDTPRKSMRSGLVLAHAAGFEHDPRQVATGEWNRRQEGAGRSEVTVVSW